MGRNSFLFSSTFYSFGAVLLLPIFNVVFGQQVPATPCPQYFGYEQFGSEIIGVIRVNGPPIGQPLHLMITLAVQGSLPSKHVGSLELSGTRDQALNKILQNEPLKYIVKFPSGLPIPQLLQMQYNNRQICNGSPDPNAQLLTTITLDHNLVTQFSNYSYSANTTYKNTYASKVVPGQPPTHYLNESSHTNIMFEQRFSGSDQNIIPPALMLPIQVPVPAHHVPAPVHGNVYLPAAGQQSVAMQSTAQVTTPATVRPPVFPSNQQTIAAPAPVARPQENQVQQSGSVIDYNYNPVQRNPLDDPPIVIDSQGIQL